MNRSVANWQRRRTLALGGTAGTVLALGAALTLRSWAGETSSAVAPLPPTTQPPTTLVAASAGRELDPPPAVSLAQQPYSLDDLLSMAATNNPTLSQATHRVAAARGAAWQAGLGPNPMAGYMAEEMGSADTAGLQGAFVSKTFITGGKLQQARAAAQQEVIKAMAECEAQRQRVRNDVQTAYYDLLVAQRALATSVELVQLSERTTQLAENLWKRGEAAETDYRLARVESTLAKIREQTVRSKHLAAWRQLAALIGLPCLAPSDVADNLRNGVPEYAWQEVVCRTLQSSPELAAAQAEVRRAEWLVARAESEPIPDVTLQANVLHDNVSGDDVAGVQASVPIPLFNRNQGGIAQARAQHRQARADAQRIALRLQHQLAAAFAQYQAAKAAVEHYAQTVLTDAERSLELTRKVYEAGETDSLKLLSAQRTYVQTRLDYIDTLGQLRKAIVQLDGYLLTGALESPGK